MASYLSGVGDGARFLARIEEIRRLPDQEARIDALQGLVAEVHAHPNDLFLFVDATARSDDAAARTLGEKYGASLPRNFGSAPTQEAPPIKTPPKLRMPHAAAHWNPESAPQRNDRPTERVSELASKLSESKQAPGPWSQLTDSPEEIALSKKHGVPANSQLRLDDALNYLLSNEGSELCARFHQHMRDHEGDFDHPVDQLHLGRNKPTDPLTADMSAFYVAQRYDGAFREELSDEARHTVIPHAVIWAMASAASPEGFVSVGKLFRSFGEAAAPLFRELSHCLEHGQKPVPTSRRGVKYRYLTGPLIDMVAKSARSPDLDARMGGFWKIVDEFGSPEALKDVIIGRSGHLVDSSDALMRALMASGGEPGALRGKHYSAHPDALAREQARGYAENKRYVKDHDAQADNALNPDYAFWNQVAMRIPKGADQAKRMLIYDDGFAMLEMFHRLEERADHLTPIIACVEQTERGALNCEQMEKNGLPLKLNPTNMPRSWLKKLIEGPAIGECVAWHIERMLFEANPDLKIEPKVAAVVGYGAVGQATAAALKKRGFQVEVFDTDPKMMQRALKDGFGVGGLDPKVLERGVRGETSPEDRAALDAARQQVFAKGHLAVNCTPGSGWSRAELGLFPDQAVFANAGSNTHWQGPAPVLELPERMGVFDFRRAEREGQNIDGNAKITQLRGLLGYKTLPEARDLYSEDPLERVDRRGLRRTQFKGQDIVSGDVAGRETNYHQVVRGEGGKEQLILYGGSVVNLKYGLPPEYAQVTYALLYVAGLLALENMSADPPRWHDIPDATQKRMRDLIEADLKKRGLSLMNPDFNKTPPLLT